MKTFFTAALLLMLWQSTPVLAGIDEISLRDLEGATHHIKDYRGKWVVVNYWATWCPPCLEEIPELIQFHDRHKENDAVVIGINMEQIGGDRLRQFVDDYLISYPVVVYSDPQQLVGNVTGLPTTYLIDPEGKVVGRRVGQIAGDEIENFIRDNK